MAIWLVRAGSKGEYEQKFIQDKKIYVTWNNLKKDISAFKNREDLTSELTQIWPDQGPNTIRNWVRQLWPFTHEAKKGDLVIVPLKSQPAINIGEITGDYKFDKNATDPYYQWFPVKWVGEAIPRTHFGQDLLYSFGAFLTICRIKRNNAEERIKKMRSNNWAPEKIVEAISPKDSNEEQEAEDEETLDLQEAAQDQISRLLEAKFKGHELTRLVEAILKAQGYTTYLSPEGPDGGVDILAGAGPLGFDAPQLCVEVKSGSSQIDRPTVDKLIGAVSKYNAKQGLFVSLGGFKTNVQKELASSFFKIRLWSKAELLENLFMNYDRLDETIKAELPLKRIWIIAAKEED